MGTRAIVEFQDEGVPVCKVHHQYDGYLQGVGAHLALFLKSGKLVNGVPILEARHRKFFNGVGCLAAQYIARFKTETGGLYVVPINTQGENYHYTVNVKKDLSCIVAFCSSGKRSKRFTIKEFLNFTKKTQ